jgi:hypothetical protein
MADRVHTGMYPMQPTRVQPRFDRAPASAKRSKLSPRHRPVLALRQLGDLDVQHPRLL